MDIQPNRRVLVTTVVGAPGARIQAWREKHDPKHAARLPPHLTLCYRAPAVALEALTAQVHHAFPASISVRLGSVFVLPHREAPLAVQVLDTTELDDARRRLFDGRYAVMGGRDDWPWHITCVRYGHSRDQEALLDAAAEELGLDEPWIIESVSCLELRRPDWESVAEWRLNSTI